MPEKTLTEKFKSLLETYLGSEGNSTELDKEKTMRTFISPEKSISVKSRIASSEPSEDNLLKTDNAIIQITEGIRLPRAPVQEKSLTPKSKQLSGDRLRPHELYKFLKSSEVSVASCSSPSGRYSEIILVAWIDENQSDKYKYAKHRFVINMMYDSTEDSWCVSAKLLKRSAYAQKDEEESVFQNRLVRTGDLSKEIKGMLLFIGMSPKAIYKKMVKAIFANDLKLSKSSSGFISLETQNHEDLQKKLTLSYSAYNSHYNGYNYNESHKNNNILS